MPADLAASPPPVARHRASACVGGRRRGPPKGRAGPAERHVPSRHVLSHVPPTTYQVQIPRVGRPRPPAALYPRPRGAGAVPSYLYLATSTRTGSPYMRCVPAGRPAGAASAHTALSKRTVRRLLLVRVVVPRRQTFPPSSLRLYLFASPSNSSSCFARPASTSARRQIAWYCLRLSPPASRIDMLLSAAEHAASLDPIRPSF